jgi:hypothetical protein
MSPVRMRRRGSRYQVTDAGRVTAKGTSKAKAQRQANLLRAVAHGWKPTRRRR